MSDLAIAADPLNTALDRAVVAAGYPTVGHFHDAVAGAYRRGLTADELDDLAEYWRAMTENAQWDALLLLQQNPNRYKWRDHRWQWVPWTDEEKADERRQFQGLEA